VPVSINGLLTSKAHFNMSCQRSPSQVSFLEVKYPLVLTFSSSVPAQIKDVADEHVAQVTGKREEAAKENPMFDVDDLV